MNSTPDPADAALDVPVADAGSSAPEEDDTVTDAAPAVAGQAADPAVEGAELIVDVVVPVDPDPQLLAAHDLALAALREITPEATIGDAAGYRVEADGVVSLRFTNRLAGYPGWFWTVSLARVDDAEPTVLEVELLPGDGALLAPDWVPWAVRLADYHAAQAALAESAPGEDEEELEDVDDLDASDFDEDGSAILHAGDVDGVDIDELADSAPEDDDSGDDEDDSEFDSDDDDSEFDDDSDFEDDDSDEDEDSDEDFDPDEDDDSDES